MTTVKKEKNNIVEANVLLPTMDNLYMEEQDHLMNSLILMEDIPTNMSFMRNSLLEFLMNIL